MMLTAAAVLLLAWSAVDCHIVVHQFATDTGYRDVTLSIAPYVTLNAASLSKCSARCLMDSRCRAVSVMKDAAACHLFDANLCSGGDVALVSAVGHVIYDRTTGSEVSCFLDRCLADNDGRCHRCRRPMHHGPRCQLIDLCPIDYEFKLGSCYALFTTPTLNQLEAQKSCRSSDGQVAPVRNKGVNTYLKDKVTKSGATMALIGVTGWGGVYEDSEGLPIPAINTPGGPFTQWAPDEPTGEQQAEACVAWKWQINGTDGTCYNLYTKMAFNSAIADCKAKGGQLAGPKDLQTHYILAELISQSETEPKASAYIGVRSNMSVANGVYLDGSPVPFQAPWSPGEPSFDTESSILIIMNTGNWRDNYASVPSAYTCEYIAEDCWEWRLRGHRESAKYRVRPNRKQTSREVICQMDTDDKGWTVVASRSRSQGKEFDRNTSEYGSGFGSIDGDFWLGNEIIHQLTDRSTSQLLIRLQYVNTTVHLTTYFDFRLENQSTGYVLHFNSFIKSHPDARDVLSASRGRAFVSCHDNAWGEACCGGEGGGWWMNDDCTHTNLNRRQLNDVDNFDIKITRN